MRNEEFPEDYLKIIRHRPLALSQAIHNVTGSICVNMYAFGVTWCRRTPVLENASGLFYRWVEEATRYIVMKNNVKFKMRRQ